MHRNERLSALRQRKAELEGFHHPDSHMILEVKNINREILDILEEQCG